MRKLYKTQARFEYKMAIKGYDLNLVRSLILAHPKAFFMHYPIRWVNNIYFDSRELASYQQNLCGALKREKIRFRWYGQLLDDIKGHIELKCKENGLVWKIIQDINSTLDLTEVTWARVVKKIKVELNPYLKVRFTERDIPVIINCYKREYYEARDSSCRLTLDYSQSVYNQRLYNKPNFSFKASVPDNIIVEFKFSPEKREELRLVMDNLPFLIDRNSKYALGVNSF